MSKESTVARLQQQIREDLAAILAIAEDANNQHRAFYDEQVETFLPQRGIIRKIENDLKRLHESFSGKGDRVPRWSYDGIKGLDGGSMTTWMAVAYSPINGKTGKDKIRLSNKAFVLYDSTLAGVMLHETTHFVLGTLDHAYDFKIIPTGEKHSKILALSDSAKYDNADNWRIFYQRMRKKVRPAA